MKHNLLLVLLLCVPFGYSFLRGVNVFSNILGWKWEANRPNTNSTRISSSTGAAALNWKETPPHVAKHMIVTFINGIYHSEKEVKDIAEYLESKFQTEVRLFYNPSSGSWVKDAYKAGFELVLRPNDLKLAKELAEHLRKALKEVRADGGRVLHIAHSGGAILTYLAAKYHLSFSESSRIDVITLGAGRSLTHKYFRGRVYNYYSRNDPVLMVDNRAAQLMKKAKNETYAIVRDAKHNTTFVYLEAIAKDPIFDHAMEGPTYRKALDWEALQYRERLSLIMMREARDRDMLRIMRKKAANATGFHHFWRSYTPQSLLGTGRLVRKYAANATNLHGVFSGKHRVASHLNTGITESHLFNTTGRAQLATHLLGSDICVNVTQQTLPQIETAPVANASSPALLLATMNSTSVKDKYEDDHLEELVDQLQFIDSR